MMTNVMMKTFLNHKIIKKIELDYIQAVKSSACPKLKVIRRPIFPKVPKAEYFEASVLWIQHTT